MGSLWILSGVLTHVLSTVRSTSPSFSKIALPLSPLFRFPHPHSRWPRDSSSKAPKQGTKGCWVVDRVLGLLWISLLFVSSQGLRQKCMLQSPKNASVCKQPTEPTPTPRKRLSPAFQKVHLGGLTPSWFQSSQIKSAHPWTPSGRNHRNQWPHACEIQAHRVHV